MKPLIFKLVILFWRIFPFKIFLSKLIKSNKWIFKKTYQELRYKGHMRFDICGNKLTMFNPGYTTIENEIFWKGIDCGWEKTSLRIWTKLSNDSNTILDIGANTGLYTFVANAANSKARIYSFEPVIRTANLFKINLALNHSKNIIFVEKAVSNKNGSAVYYDINTKSQYSSSLNKEMLSNVDGKISYEVETIALDNYPFDLSRPIDLVKIDVEMHEPEVISGMIKIIKDHKPAIIIEILNDEIGKKIEKLIMGLGYLYFSIDENTPPKRVDYISKSDFHNFLLCTPAIAKKLNL